MKSYRILQSHGTSGFVFAACHSAPRLGRVFATAASTVAPTTATPRQNTETAGHRGHFGTPKSMNFCKLPPPGRPSTNGRGVLSRKVGVKPVHHRHPEGSAAAPGAQLPNQVTSAADRSGPPPHFFAHFIYKPLRREKVTEKADFIEKSGNTAHSFWIANKKKSFSWLLVKSNYHHHSSKGQLADLLFHGIDPGSHRSQPLLIYSTSGF